jgi:hypothetical protein
MFRVLNVAGSAAFFFNEKKKQEKKKQGQQQQIHRHMRTRQTVATNGQTKC